MLLSGPAYNNDTLPVQPPGKNHQETWLPAKVCDIVKIVKQETTYYLWHKYGSLLSKQYWKKKIFWSDGYFACSIGEVSSATIQKYIENQG